jgi:hypothetical protein
MYRFDVGEKGMYVSKVFAEFSSIKQNGTMWFERDDFKEKYCFPQRVELAWRAI